jgi:hypothetical protein
MLGGPPRFPPPGPMVCHISNILLLNLLTLTLRICMACLHLICAMAALIPVAEEGHQDVILFLIPVTYNFLTFL